MRICGKCGYSNDDKAAFCSQCGENIVNNNIDNPIDESIATILCIIAYVVGVFSSGIMGLLKFGIDIIAYTPLWLPPVFFAVGLFLVIFSKIKYHTKNSTFVLVLYIILGIINMVIYYLLIGGFVTIMRAIFDV